MNRPPYESPILADGKKPELSSFSMPWKMWLALLVKEISGVGTLTTTAASAYSILATDRVVKITATSSTATLPSAVANANKSFTVINASSGNITLATVLSQTIAGASTKTIAPNVSMTVYSDGANYWII